MAAYERMDDDDDDDDRAPDPVVGMPRRWRAAVNEDETAEVAFALAGLAIARGCLAVAVEGGVAPRMPDVQALLQAENQLIVALLPLRQPGW